MVEKLAKDLGNNRVVDFSIVDLGLDKDKKKASVVVEYSYYSLTFPDLKYRKEVQIWDYDDDQNNWYITDIRTIVQ